MSKDDFVDSTIILQIDVIVLVWDTGWTPKANPIRPPFWTTMTTTITKDFHAKI